MCGYYRPASYSLTYLIEVLEKFIGESISLDCFYDEDGFVHMYERCKKVKNLDITDEWVLVTTWYIDPPEGTKFVTCPLCG